eukprot:TRINITY_DN3227_c3_g3_i1.p1 TRINITY_DN3227_c3_g3~~TRINITY_DN3227_c3_g3_i1.p1  ORF type:complete len:1228 (+),score=372.38 TRINITY_DN3227_c3_g3_i1:549-4232(+)
MDSDIFIAGTEFMEKLSNALKWYVRIKLEKDESWKEIKVILSDISKPGEGEHKIMDFIRSQRAMNYSFECNIRSKDILSTNEISDVRKGLYDPNLKHCIYCPDSDMVLLSLCVHEQNIHILREDLCGARKKTNENLQKLSKLFPNFDIKYQFLNIKVLREYFDQYFGNLFNLRTRLGNKYDLERLIDDFVFICLFIDNDYLPHLPSMDISHGAINKFVNSYLSILPELKGYLTERGILNFERIGLLLEHVSKKDPKKVFKKRFEKQKRFELDDSSIIQLQKIENLTKDTDENNVDTIQTKNKELLKGITEKVKQKENNFIVGADSIEFVKTKVIQINGVDTEVSEHTFAENNINYHLDGYKERYYNHKMEILLSKGESKEGAVTSKNLGRIFSHMNFGRSEQIITFGYKPQFLDVIQTYCEGLVWTFLYFTRGCHSWNWFYPFHYAPMIGDLCLMQYIHKKKIYAFFNVNLSLEMENMKKCLKTPKKCLNNEKSIRCLFADDPLKPFEQMLMMIPKTQENLKIFPKVLQNIICDDKRTLKSYFPIHNFKIDLNDQDSIDKGICLLPFIPKSVIDENLKDLNFNDDEIRNCFGVDQLFVITKHSLHDFILKTLNFESESLHIFNYSEYLKNTDTKEWLSFKQGEEYQLFGSIRKDTCFDPKNTEFSPLNLELTYRTLYNVDLFYFEAKSFSNVVSCLFQNPSYPFGYNFAGYILTGTDRPIIPALSKEDRQKFARDISAGSKIPSDIKANEKSELDFEKDKEYHWKESVPVLIADSNPTKSDKTDYGNNFNEYQKNKHFSREVGFDHVDKKNSLAYRRSEDIFFDKEFNRNEDERYSKKIQPKYEKKQKTWRNGKNTHHFKSNFRDQQNFNDTHLGEFSEKMNWNNKILDANPNENLKKDVFSNFDQKQWNNAYDNNHYDNQEDSGNKWNNSKGNKRYDNDNKWNNFNDNKKYDSGNNWNYSNDNKKYGSDNKWNYSNDNKKYDSGNKWNYSNDNKKYDSGNKWNNSKGNKRYDNDNKWNNFNDNTSYDSGNNWNYSNDNHSNYYNQNKKSDNPQMEKFSDGGQLQNQNFHNYHEKKEDRHFFKENRRQNNFNFQSKNKQTPNNYWQQNIQDNNDMNGLSFDKGYSNDRVPRPGTRRMASDNRKMKKSPQRNSATKSLIDDLLSQEKESTRVAKKERRKEEVLEKRKIERELRDQNKASKKKNFQQRGRYRNSGRNNGGNRGNRRYRK